jgi:hypothetical protein
VAGLRNFAALARNVVRPGGHLVLTVLLGDTVHALLADVPAGGSWDVHEDGALKFSLRRLYSGAALEAAGQRIGVLLPFSDGGYYEEFLVNPAALGAELGARGFSRVPTAANAAAAIPEFEARNHQLTLTEGDRRWLSLYGELVFVRE